MNFLKKQWETFKQKSLFGKLTDIGFYLFLVMLIIPDGRLLIQRGILETGLFGSTDRNESLQLSEEVADWQLVALNGDHVTFEEVNKKPVFLNFWATWCPPCKAEMPSIQATYEEVGERINVVLVSSESPEKVSAFMEKSGYTFPVYTLGTGIPEDLKSRSLPTTFVITQEGIVVHRSEGMRKWDAASLKALLTDS